MIIDGITYRICTQCKEQLPRGLFSKHDGYIDGWSYRCKKCVKSKAKKKTGGVYKDKKFARAQVMRYGHAKL